jgi:hypothetical protein
MKKETIEKYQNITISTDLAKLATHSFKFSAMSIL